MMKLTSQTTMKFEQQNTEYDYDTYEFEVISGFATKEYTVTICFKDMTLTGDCVAYGDWFTIEIKECMPFVNYLIDNKLLLRDITNIIKNYEKGSVKI